MLRRYIHDPRRAALARKLTEEGEGGCAWREIARILKREGASHPATGVFLYEIIDTGFAEDLVDPYIVRALVSLFPCTDARTPDVLNHALELATRKARAHPTLIYILAQRGADPRVDDHAAFRNMVRTWTETHVEYFMRAYNITLHITDPTVVRAACDARQWCVMLMLIRRGAHAYEVTDRASFLDHAPECIRNTVYDKENAELGRGDDAVLVKGIH